MAVCKTCGHAITEEQAKGSPFCPRCIDRGRSDARDRRVAGLQRAALVTRLRPEAPPLGRGGRAVPGQTSDDGLGFGGFRLLLLLEAPPLGGEAHCKADVDNNRLGVNWRNWRF